MVSNSFHFYPYLGNWFILPNIFQMGWFNHHLDNLKCVFFQCEEMRWSNRLLHNHPREALRKTLGCGANVNTWAQLYHRFPSTKRFARADFQAFFSRAFLEMLSYISPKPWGWCIGELPLNRWWMPPRPWEAKFRRVFYVPGNHELWLNPSEAIIGDGFGGAEGRDISAPKNSYRWISISCKQMVFF